MKLTTSLFNLAIAAIAAGTLVSCTNEFSDMNPGKDGLSSIKLVKNPEVYAWSGQQTLQNTVSAPSDVITRGTDMNANMWNQTWDCPSRPAEDLTDEELAELKALLSKGKETHNDVILPFENYYVQQIYKGEDRYNTHDRCERADCDHVNDQTELGSGHMDKLLAYGKGNYEHVNNFNNGSNDNYPGACGCGEVHYKTTLMTGMPTEGIDPNKQFGFHETWGTAHDYFNYIIVEYKGYYYVGFDYEAHKYDQNTHNHGEGLDIERDWNFTDWIVRITPAYHKGETPSDNPGGVTGDVKPNPDPTPNPNPDPETSDKCKKCGHPSHEEGNCEECKPNDPCGQCPNCPHKKHEGKDCEECEEGTTCRPKYIDCPLCHHKLMLLPNGDYVHVAGEKGIGVSCEDCKTEHKDSKCSDADMTPIPYDDALEQAGESGNGSTTPSNPATPDKTYKHNNEVEVNLEIVDSHEDKGIKDLATKLSIHVRCATDVEIILPVPAKYTIDSDDLYILQNHYIDGKNGVYGGSELEGDGVVLTYEIANTTVELHVQVLADCIKVWTVGINQDVIDYCMLHNGDGINFEVWTYYALENGDLTRATLKELLDDSTIEFKGDPSKNQVSPFYYINAFGYDYNGLNKTEDKNLDDCIVTPSSDYVWKYTGATHLNGTPYNEIYVKSGNNADATHSNGTLVSQQASPASQTVPVY